MKDVKKLSFVFIVFCVLSMVCPPLDGLVITSEADQYDYKLLYSMGRYLRQYEKQQAITFGDMAPDQWTYTLRLGEPIYIIASGSEGKIGNMDGAQVAALLKKIDYKNLTLVHIYVYSCCAGTENSTGDSLIGDICKEFIGFSEKVSICGPDGYGITDESLKPPKSELVLIEKYKDCFFDFVQKPAQEKLESQCPDCVDERTYKAIEDLVERANKAFDDEHIQAFFKKLTEAKNLKFFYEQGTHLPECSDK